MITKDGIPIVFLKDELPMADVVIWIVNDNGQSKLSRLHSSYLYENRIDGWLKSMDEAGYTMWCYANRDFYKKPEL